MTAQKLGLRFVVGLGWCLWVGRVETRQSPKFKGIEDWKTGRDEEGKKERREGEREGGWRDDRIRGILKRGRVRWRKSKMTKRERGRQIERDGV